MATRECWNSIANNLNVAGKRRTKKDSFDEHVAERHECLEGSARSRVTAQTKRQSRAMTKYVKQMVSLRRGVLIASPLRLVEEERTPLSSVRLWERA